MSNTSWYKLGSSTGITISGSFFLKLSGGSNVSPSSSRRGVEYGVSIGVTLGDAF